MKYVIVSYDSCRKQYILIERFRRYEKGRNFDDFGELLERVLQASEKEESSVIVRNGLPSGSCDSIAEEVRKRGIICIKEG